MTSAAGLGADLARGALPRSLSPKVRSRARWTTKQAREWETETGWLVGCNFVPSTAGNQLEMWQEATFDPTTIDRELGWSASLGFNTARVFLHDLLWAADGDEFLDRIEQVLAIADRHDIALLPVLFDGVWHPEPELGVQPEPRPGVHNSIWVQGPGRAVLADPTRWPELRPYVTAVLTRFGSDDRVVAWDLFNEPDQRNSISWPRKEMPRKTPAADGLLNTVFDWAQAVDPEQPLTAGVFIGVSGAVERASRINRTMLGRSDIISFHSYAPRRRLERTIDHLRGYDRPLVCTEWLARTAGSTVDLLEVFAERQVGAYCWGLVDGRSQARFPWTSWIRPSDGGGTWFHDLLHPDGSPYDRREVDLIRRVTA